MREVGEVEVDEKDLEQTWEKMARKRKVYNDKGKEPEKDSM